MEPSGLSVCEMSLTPGYDIKRDVQPFTAAES